MSISPVSSSISSGYDSTEVQNLKLKSGKEELSQKTGNITEKAVVESKTIETKSEASSEDGSTVGISSHGDTVEISKQGMSKAQGMSAAPNSASVEQSASTGTASTVSATSAASASAQAAAVLKPAGTADTESSSTSSTADLSSDSDYELKQKLVKGTITQSQYYNEIKKRGKDTESAEVDYSTNQNEEVSK